MEEDYFSFDRDSSDGTGYAFSIVVGGEYFFRKNFSFQMDFGPGWIKADNSNTDNDESGIDIVINFGLNWYFGGK